MGSCQVEPCEATLISTHGNCKMVVPDSIKDKVGALPDVSSMNKDDLSALCLKVRAVLRRVRGEVPHGGAGQEEGRGAAQPGGRVHGHTRHLQGPQTQEGQQI